MTTGKQTTDKFIRSIAILGGGNIGRAMASGFVKVGSLKPGDIHITRRTESLLDGLKAQGFRIGRDNIRAVKACKTVIVAVQPGQLLPLMEEIREFLQPKKHILLSAVTGVSIKELEHLAGLSLPIIRIMPNTAVAIGESMTCLAYNAKPDRSLQTAVRLFDRVGQTMVISEEQMTPATALCACGIAFFLRSIRAASQGGIEIGFHAEEALTMAAQTARGAASLLLNNGVVHPESEIDKVTTPRGCTIAGLNRMEHEGFSSAMIKGLVTSTRIAAGLFHDPDPD